MITVFGDSHFGKSPGRDESLIRFLNVLKTDHLILMGDIFHFYFEYKYGVYKKNIPLIHTLLKVKEKGTNVIFVPGNHDLWIGEFLKSNFMVLPEKADIVLEGMKFHLLHFIEFNSLIRSKAVISFFSLLPIDIGYRLGIKIAKFTEKKKEGDMIKLILEYSKKVDADFLIFAHSHIPLIKYLSDKIILNPGGWVNELSYIEVKKGVPSLKIFGTP